VYVRLHSRNADAWYRSGEERYDYDYSDTELGEWIDELRRHNQEDAPERALFLFNNCQRSQAAVNARRMQALLGERAPQVRQVEPFAAPPAVQRTLFDAVGEVGS
jgi:uncharacterized protein YecE (DUF72 family)